MFISLCLENFWAESFWYNFSVNQLSTIVKKLVLNKTCFAVQRTKCQTTVSERQIQLADTVIIFQNPDCVCCCLEMASCSWILIKWIIQYAVVKMIVKLSQCSCNSLECYWTLSLLKAQYKCSFWLFTPQSPLPQSWKGEFSSHQGYELVGTCMNLRMFMEHTTFKQLHWNFLPMAIIKCRRSKDSLHASLFTVFWVMCSFDTNVYLPQYW